ncbi:MAG: hypothetical protein HOP02_17430 [Methylococcaceae bacterium]|nr:hypothetical protein [Methylococcaceae bacterium]
MNNFNIKPLVIGAGLSLVTMGVSAQLITSKSVLNKTDSAVISAKFDEAVTGDLYLTTTINGKLVFFADQGKTLTDKALPYQKEGVFNANLDVLTISAQDFPANQYTFYEVITTPGGDPLDFNNWVGGLNGLYSLTVDINLPIAKHKNGEIDRVKEDCKAPVHHEKNKHNGHGHRENNTHDGHNNGEESACTPTPTVTPSVTPTVIPSVLPTAIPSVTPTEIPKVRVTPAPTPIPDCVDTNDNDDDNQPGAGPETSDNDEDNDDNIISCEPTAFSNQ